MMAIAAYLQAIIKMIIKLGNLMIEIVQQSFIDLWELGIDLSIYVYDGLLNVFVYMLSVLPVPDFMSGGLQSIVSKIDPSITYFVGQTGLGYAISILGAGYSFSILRRVLTLGKI